MVAWQIKNKDMLLCWERNLPQFSLFHLLCQFCNATHGIITTSTNNWLRSEEYTVWVFVTFWKSKCCKFGDHFSPSFPHFHTWECHWTKNSSFTVWPLFSLTCSSEGVNLKSSVKNTDKFFKEPHLGFYQGPRRAMGTYSQKPRVSNLEFLCFFCWQA